MMLYFLAKWKENILKSFNRVLPNKKNDNVKLTKSLMNVKLVSKNFIILSLLMVLCMGYVDQFESNSVVKKSSDKSSNASNIYIDVPTAVSIQSEMISSSAIIYKSANAVLDNGQQNQKSEYIQTKLGTTDDALTKSTPLITNGTPQGKVSNYVVAKGDNLTSVASKFNITTQTIRWNNGIELGDEIKEGQNITVLPTNGVLHTISDQDSFDSLASKYKSTKEMIISYNGVLDDNMPKVGSKLIVPDGVIEEKPKVVVNTVNNNTTTRPVQSTTSANTALTNYSPRANTYSYGQCTWYAASRRNIPNTWGNANTWYSRAQSSGFSVGTTPVAGAIAWTGIGYYGHVAIVEQVNGNQVLISEMNFNGNWGRVTTRWIPANSYAYIY